MQSTRVFLIRGGSGWITGLPFDLLQGQGRNLHSTTIRMELRDAVLAELERVVPTHVLNCAGITGRPNVDWCEVNKQNTLRSNLVGTANLVDCCCVKKIHCTVFGTGCIHTYDEQQPMPSGLGFTEGDPANFRGSYYSFVKAQAESLMMSAYGSNTLVLHLRMPVSDDLYPRSFVTKITKYSFFVDVPNSNSILSDSLPCSIMLAENDVTGIFNFTNPGVISHNQVLSFYKQYVEPSFHWRNLTLEEQSKVLKAGRSNCELDSLKLVRKMHEYEVRMPNVFDAYVQCFKRMAKLLPQQQLRSSPAMKVPTARAFETEHNGTVETRDGGDPITTRPSLLFMAHPLTGHLTPTLRIAAELKSRGWPVTFLGPTSHSEKILQAGVNFMPFLHDADLDDLAYYSKRDPKSPIPGYWEMPWPERAMVDMKITVIDPIPAQWASVKAALIELHEQGPRREVVIVSESMFHGILPLIYGARMPHGVRHPRTAVLSVTVPLIRSIDLPPFGYPLPFDQSPAGRARNAACWSGWASQSVWMSDLLNRRLEDAGCTQKPQQPLVASSGINYTSHDIIMQLGVPGFYFPRSDWPAQFKFVGIIPAAQAPVIGWSNLPEWWEEVTTTEKRVVIVAQGTVEVDPHDLILPTMRATEDRDDLLVVVILGRKHATLPIDAVVPENTRVIDHLPYDAILPHADVWVHNGGYGAVQHGIVHGVPMLVGGEAQDKTENRKRIVYSGIGVDLGTAKPSDTQVRKGLDTVLGEESYLKRAQALQREAKALDCFGIVESQLWGLVQSK